jgi:hypothetical protein
MIRVGGLSARTESSLLARFTGTQNSHDLPVTSIADPSSANFFFWGHGKRDRFSFDDSFSARPESVLAEEIADRTGNPGGPNARLGKFAHPYRFVFMDACGTYSVAMARAFGIQLAVNNHELGAIVGGSGLFHVL